MKTSHEDAVIETQRLLLREMTPDDAPALLKVFGDAEAMRHYPAAFDEARMQAWVTWNRRSYETSGHGLWAMILRSTGEVIGDCGLVSQEVDGVSEIEVGYHVRRDLWGQGLATEAALACIDHGFTQFGFRWFVSLIHPQNASSRRVAEKIGMTLWREAEWKGKATCIYAIERGTRVS
ncbi:MAG: GNAT family N-acetyltransferase [Verrucomicrobiaceae bacterium]